MEHRTSTRHGGMFRSLIDGCQWPLGSPHLRPLTVPAGGRGFSPPVASGSPRVVEVPHPLACGGFLQPEGIAINLDDVGMVQEPVHGGGREGLGHDGVEVAGVEVAADR